MRHKLGTAVFSQGWLEGQLENNVAKTAEKENEDPTAHLIATQMLEQWAVISQTLDDLIKENADLNRRMAVVKSALV